MSNDDLIRRLRKTADEETDMDSAWVDPILREAADALERGRWIPVSERTPNATGRVLIAGKDNVSDAVFMTGQFYQTNTPYCVSIAGITHWMPLPKPPAMPDAGNGRGG